MRRYRSLIPLILLLFLVFTAVWLRLVNLGYSDYYGDEIKAMWRPGPGQSAIDYLFAQKKGPTQFLVTYLVKFIDPTFTNELLLRLPFTLAGILAIYFFYRLVEINFNKKIALYATFLFSINGLFVGLMRIAQYQPFVILFSVLTLYCFSLASYPKWNTRGIPLGVLFWVAGLLSHYDAIFITPFALYLLFRWYKKNANQPVRFYIQYLLIPFVLGGLLLAAYFVPYFLSIPGSTTSYWLNRLTDESNTTGKLSSSIANYVLYNPVMGLPAYLVFGILALTKIKQLFPLLLWFIFPWIVMEVFIHEPGTHIYNYVMPGIILVAYGLEVVEDFLLKIGGRLWGSRINLVWLAIFFATLAGISHLIFVDHTPEYPFEERRILFWRIGGGSTEILLWSYGFPYYRRWEDIGKYVTSMEGNGYYYSNEEFPISSYFVPFNHSAKNAGIYIYIYYPQTFDRRELSEKAHYWRTRYEPVKVFRYQDKKVAEIYVMPAGSLGDIKSNGY